MREKGADVSRYRIVLPLVLVLLWTVRGHAQTGGDARLSVCNKGSLGIYVATGKAEQDLAFRHYWNLEGWTKIDPGGCEEVYSDHVSSNAYLAFAIADASGVRRPAVVNANVTDRNKEGRPVFSRTDKKFCLRLLKFAYNTFVADPGTDCGLMEVLPGDRGQYVAFPATLYFQPDGSVCYDNMPSWMSRCGGGDYTLDVVPVSRDKAMAAEMGSNNESQEKSSAENSADVGATMRAMADAMQKARQKAAANTPGSGGGGMPASYCTANTAGRVPADAQGNPFLCKKSITPFGRENTGSTYGLTSDQRRVALGEIDALTAKGQQVIQCEYGPTHPENRTGFFTYTFWYRSAPENIRGFEPPATKLFPQEGVIVVNECPATKAEADVVYQSRFR